MGERIQLIPNVEFNGAKQDDSPKTPCSLHRKRMTQLGAREFRHPRFTQPSTFFIGPGGLHLECSPPSQ